MIVILALVCSRKPRYMAAWSNITNVISVAWSSLRTKLCFLGLTLWVPLSFPRHPRIPLFTLACPRKWRRLGLRISLFQLGMIQRFAVAVAWRYPMILYLLFRGSLASMSSNGVVVILLSSFSIFAILVVWRTNAKPLRNLLASGLLLAKVELACEFFLV